MVRKRCAVYQYIYRWIWIETSEHPHCVYGLGEFLGAELLQSLTRITILRRPITHVKAEITTSNRLLPVFLVHAEVVVGRLQNVAVGHDTVFNTRFPDGCHEIVPNSFRSVESS